MFGRVIRTFWGEARLYYLHSESDGGLEAENAAMTSPHLFPFFVLQTGWSENVVQGLSLRRGHVGLPEVHHEDHPGAVV